VGEANAYEPAALAGIEAAGVVLGGNIDPSTLETILAGNTP
jgi:hypothetical protein